VISPAVSVIVPTRDRPHPLAQTLLDLESQPQGAGGFEVVVVDDGAGPAVSLDPPATGVVRQFIRSGGTGRSAARNAGAEKAQGNLLVFIDDDITVGPGFIDAHLKAQRDWPGVLGVGAIRLLPEASRSPFGRFRQRLEDKEQPAERGLSGRSNLCAAGNMSVPRDTFLSIGGFDSSIASGEDQDFALRHSARGGRIAFLPEARVVHRDSALDARSYCRRVEWGAEHMVTFCRRHPEWPDNAERQLVNGPLRWGKEPLPTSFKKAAKALLGTPAGVKALFLSVGLMERLAPGSAALDRLYEILLGVHILRGFRRGLAAQASART
jgi:GT2 family glycosyltransferase